MSLEGITARAEEEEVAIVMVFVAGPERGPW
jgi:hypothetical protein